MVITYHGGQHCKVTFGSTTLAFNPVGKKSKLDSIKYGADVAFVSLWHEDFNGVENVTHGNKAPFVVDTPGEFEISDVTARGFGVPTTYGTEETFNTIYQVRLEDMNMIFMGAVADPDIDPHILGEFGEIDILFIPIGGGDVLEVPQASKLAVKLEAKLIIPIQYDAAALQAFLKEEGNETVTAVDKLTIKKKDVAVLSGEVAVLKG